MHEQANAPPWGAQRSHPSLSFPGGPSVCPGDRDLPARGQGCSRELTAGRGRASLCPGGNGGGPGTPRRQTVALYPLAAHPSEHRGKCLLLRCHAPATGCDFSPVGSPRPHAPLPQTQASPLLPEDPQSPSPSITAPWGLSPSPCGPSVCAPPNPHMTLTQGDGVSRRGLWEGRRS